MIVDLDSAVGESPAIQQEALEEWIEGRIRSLLKRDEAFSRTKPLREIGLDSVMMVELRGEMERALARKLPAALLFNHPSVRALARFIGTLVASTTAPSAPTNAEITR